MQESKLLKCRFCDFHTPKYRKLRDGRFRCGWNILNSHIEVEHPEKWDEIMQWWDDYQNKPGEDYYCEWD